MAERLRPRWALALTPLWVFAGHGALWLASGYRLRAWALVLGASGLLWGVGLLWRGVTTARLVGLVLALVLLGVGALAAAWERESWRGCGVLPGGVVVEESGRLGDDCELRAWRRWGPLERPVAVGGGSSGQPCP